VWHVLFSKYDVWCVERVLGGITYAHHPNPASRHLKKSLVNAFYEWEKEVDPMLLQRGGLLGKEFMKGIKRKRRQKRGRKKIKNSSHKKTGDPMPDPDPTLTPAPVHASAPAVHAPKFVTSQGGWSSAQSTHSPPGLAPHPACEGVRTQHAQHSAITYMFSIESNTVAHTLHGT
jgi:hypothetical protein